MSDARDRLIVALDTDEIGARTLLAELGDSVRWVKIGMTLFYQCGPGIVCDFTDAGYGVFLDLKLHDIPHQVRGAAASVARLGAGMLTVHAGGGAEMVRAAVEGVREGAVEASAEPPVVLAVTVLTSMDDQTLQSVGVPASADEQVRRLAELAIDAGADGIVCSPREAAEMRSLLGRDAFIVTPGVRPRGAATDDQSRVATAADALSAGASHLVIGRPITAAAAPAEAARSLIAEIAAAIA